MNVFEIRYMNRHVVHVLTCHHHPIDFRKFKRLDVTAPFFFFDKNGLRFLSNMKRRIKPGWGYLLAQLNFMVITGLLRECFYGNYNNNLINS